MNRQRPDFIDVTPQQLVCQAIVAFGHGNHPYPDSASLRFFVRDYAVACLKEAESYGWNADFEAARDWAMRNLRPPRQLSEAA